MNTSQNPRVCISLCEPNVAALERAVEEAVQVCDLIEVRLDCLEPLELENCASLITKLLQQSACKSILTFRPMQEGGKRALDEATRQAFWSDAIFSSSFFDLELELAERLHTTETSSSLPIDWSRTICSHHDFDGMPATLDQIYDRMGRTPARILKMAVKADDAIDCLQVFKLLDRAREDGREMIAIAMGKAGVVTRILGPSRGSFLTYASLDNEKATAPGQLTISELNEVYRLANIDRNTQVFGLVGRPISYSLSPRIHNAALAATRMNAVYVPLETGDIKTFLKRMVHPRTRELDWRLHGLSVTAPHKFAVMDQLDWIERAAREIGAVNTIVVEGDELNGFNTDALGFIKPLEKMFGDLRDAHCAVIGAGGAGSAALWSLRNAGAKTDLFARDTTKANALAERFGVGCLPLEGGNFESFDLVVNATPLGTLGEFEHETVAKAYQLRGTRLVYDLVYNPTETRLLREAREAGCRTLGGLAMLVAQAAEQFKLWTGALPPDGVMYEAAERGLMLPRFEI